MSNTGMNARFMRIDEVLSQLSSLKDNSADMARREDADKIWQNDVYALEAAIAIISALQDEGISDAEGVKDLIFDYTLAAKQNKELHRKFEVPSKALKKDGVFHCPECNHRVSPYHSFCHWCGKKLGWG